VLAVVSEEELASVLAWVSEKELASVSVEPMDRYHLQHHHLQTMLLRHLMLRHLLVPTVLPLLVELEPVWVAYTRHMHHKTSSDTD